MSVEETEEKYVAYRAVTEDGELVPLPEGTRVVNKKQNNAFQEKLAKDELKNKAKMPFVFVVQDSITTDLAVLSNKYLGYLLIMMTYTDYLGMLKNTPDSTNPMTRTELKAALKIKSDRTLTILIRDLQEKGIVYQSNIKTYRKKRKAIYLNSGYCFRGNLKSSKNADRVVKVFMSNLQQVYQNETVTAADIGFLYRILPFIHYNSNILVANPNERNDHCIESLTVSEVAEKVGLSRTQTSSYINRIKWGDQYVFAKIYVGSFKEPRIKVNPFIFYRKAGEPKGIGGEFALRDSEKAK